MPISSFKTNSGPLLYLCLLASLRHDASSTRHAWSCLVAMVVPLMQSISSNSDCTYTLYMFPCRTGMLGLPCRPCSGMLRSGCKWSLIRLCTHHVRRVHVALMLVKLAVATLDFKCPSSWHISNGHFVHLGTSPKQCGSCASTRKPKA